MRREKAEELVEELVGAVVNWRGEIHPGADRDYIQFARDEMEKVKAKLVEALTTAPADGEMEQLKHQLECERKTPCEVMAVSDECDGAVQTETERPQAEVERAQAVGTAAVFALLQARTEVERLTKERDSWHGQRDECHAEMDRQTQMKKEERQEKLAARAEAADLKARLKAVRKWATEYGYDTEHRELDHVTDLRVKNWKEKL
jgi:hypothetical protein